MTDPSTLSGFLQGGPAPEWTRRPNAKDDLRAKAREPRTEGLNYNLIAARLGVSKSSVSLWVRDLPTPDGLSRQEVHERAAEASRQYWAGERALRGAQRAAKQAAAAAEIGELSDREIIIAGAIAYWCEGSKSKPYTRGDRVIFTNSDPRLSLFFLRKTTRKNVGDGYHGCLRIEVRRGTRLYGRIEGWATAAMAG